MYKNIKTLIFLLAVFLMPNISLAHNITGETEIGFKIEGAESLFEGVAEFANPNEFVGTVFNAAIHAVSPLRVLEISSHSFVLDFIFLKVDMAGDKENQFPNKYYLIIILIVFLLFCTLGSLALYLQRRVKEALAMAHDSDEQMSRQAHENEFILQAMPVGLEIYSSDGVLISMNSFARKMFGFGLSAQEISIFDNPLFPEEYKEKFRNGEPYYFEINYEFSKIRESNYYETTFTNEVKILAFEAAPMLTSDGKVEKFIQVIRDVTLPRKRVKLIDTMKKSLSLALDASNISVWGYNIAQDKLFDINGNIFIDGPMSLREGITLIHPDDVERFAPVFNRAINGESSQESIVIRFKNMTTGEYEYIRKRITSIKDSEGKVTELIGTHLNITSHVLMSEEKDKLLLSLNMAIKAASLKIGYLDVETMESYALIGNNFEIQAESIESISASMHPEDRGECSKMFHAIMDGSIKSATRIFRLFNRATGKFDYYEYSLISICNEYGKLIRIAGTMKDVTKEQLYNKQLEDGQAKLNLALIAGKVSAWTYDDKTHIFTSILGSTFAGSGLSMRQNLTILHPEDRAVQLEMLGSMMDGTSKFSSGIFRYKKSPQSTEYRYYEFCMNPQSEDGKIIGLIGTQRDVTEPYLHSEALEESQMEVKLAIKASGAVQWKFDCKSNTFSVADDFLVNGDTGAIDKDFYSGEMAHPDDREVLQNGVNQMMNKEDHEIIFDARMRRKGEDEWHYMNITGMPVKNGKGEIYKYSGFRRDLSEWMKMKEDLLERNTQLNLALKAGHVMPFVWDFEKDRFFISSAELNDSFKDLDGENVGIDRAQMISLLHPDDRERAEEVLRKIRSGAQPQLRGEARYNPRYNFENYFEINILTIRSEGQQKVTKAVGYMQDITERRHLLKDLETARLQAIESNKLKSAFLANMSHEIRTPLNAIVGFSELLKDAEDAADKELFWNIISTNNDLLLRLIGDILDLSKIESGMMEFKRERFDLSGLYDDLAISLKQRITNPEIEFFCDNPYKSCFVDLDKNRITQIITNFVTNAIKYTPSGFIRMGYIYENGGIKIKVSDSGIGVADEKKYRVFHRFEKLDDFAQGTGLGLSICKAIAEANGGSVGFDSIVNKGSTFWAWIPCDAEISRESNNSIAEVQKEMVSSESILRAHLKILVAEDIDSNYMLVKSILKGVNLIRAVNGSEAVDMVHSDKFDMVLMDMRMPVMDGITATRKIRVFDITTPIVAVTANAFDTDRSIAIEAGCNDFVAKPLKKKILLDVIAKNLGISNLVSI